MSQGPKTSTIVHLQTYASELFFLRWKIDRLVQVENRQAFHKKNQRGIPGYLLPNCKGHGTLFFSIFLTIQEKIDRNDCNLNSAHYAGLVTSKERNTGDSVRNTGSCNPVVNSRAGRHHLTRGPWPSFFRHFAPRILNSLNHCPCTMPAHAAKSWPIGPTEAGCSCKELKPCQC